MAPRWYAVSVLSNFEKRVAESIKDAVPQNGLEEDILQVLVPTEDVIEVRRGKKVQTERRFMPGYVLVQMNMSDAAYHLIKNTNRVTGFLGPQGKPVPMRDAEVNAILKPGRGRGGASAQPDLLRCGRAGECDRRAVRGLRRHGRRCGRG